MHRLLGDSLQGSIYLTHLDDSTLQYDISIIRNWRYDFLKTKGIVKLIQNVNMKALGGLYYESDYYAFREYSEVKGGDNISIFVGKGEAFVCFNFNKGKRKIPCDDKFSFWSK